MVVTDIPIRYRLLAIPKNGDKVCKHFLYIDLHNLYLQFTLQLALSCFAEYVFHFTRLNPDMMYLHQDSGLMNIAYFKFDIDDSTGISIFFFASISLCN